MCEQEEIHFGRRSCLDKKSGRQLDRFSLLGIVPLADWLDAHRHEPRLTAPLLTQLPDAVAQSRIKRQAVNQSPISGAGPISLLPDLRCVFSLQIIEYITRGHCTAILWHDRDNLSARHKPIGFGCPVFNRVSS